MKLYIKRDISAENSLFTVFDSLGREKYYVTGQKSVLYISDMNGVCVAKIRQLPLPAIRAYSLSAGKRGCKFIINSSPTASNCYFYGLGWHIRGSIFIKSFDIIDADNSVVATHCERFGEKGRGWELNVSDEYNELLALCTAVCVNLDVRSNARIPVSV